MNQNSDLKRNYSDLLYDDEEWWCHSEDTIDELTSTLNLMKRINRLPDCFWLDICGIHTTNRSSVYSLTERMINKNYPGTIFFKVKPSAHFLEWIIENLKQKK